MNYNISLHLVNEETQNRGREMGKQPLKDIVGPHLVGQQQLLGFLSASSSLEAPVWRHQVTRDRHLPQPKALKSGQILGRVIGPHSRHNKGGKGVRCSQYLQYSYLKKKETRAGDNLDQNDHYSSLLHSASTLPRQRY